MTIEPIYARFCGYCKSLALIALESPMMTIPYVQNPKNLTKAYDFADEAVMTVCETCYKDILSNANKRI